MAKAVLKKYGPRVILRVHPRDVPVLLGHLRENQRRLSFDYCADNGVPRACVSVNFTTNNTCVRLLDVIDLIL